MSDFDKEKEREKLREKYEQEQESREVAEKMSELLLQGATMTNAHCSDCGDPIFRYDGQEFCATCEKPVERDTGDDADAEDADAGDETDADADAEGRNIEVTSPSDEARVQFGSDGEASDTPDEAADAPESTPDAERADADGAAQPARDTGAGRSELGRPDRTRARERPDADRASADTGDVSAARASLVRTLARFSERAERCEDPGRAREHLAAAREAAEALAALRR